VEPPSATARLFGGILEKQEVGLTDSTQEYVPVGREFAHDTTQRRGVIQLVHFAQVP